MRYKAEVSKQVEGVLKKLAREDRTRCRELALVLLRLEKEPAPEGSRPLEPKIIERMEGEREWIYGKYRILYRIDEKKKVVETGRVSRLGEERKGRRREK